MSSKILLISSVNLKINCKQLKCHEIKCLQTQHKSKFTCMVNGASKVTCPYSICAPRTIPTIIPRIISLGTKNYLVMNKCQFGNSIAQFYEWLGILFDLEVDKISV